MLSGNHIEHLNRPLSVIFLLLFSCASRADHPVSLSELTVTERYTGFKQYVVNPDLINAPVADTGQLLKKIPGANVNSNGTVTGIAQYRGMYGDRVNILIDGIKISPGGPALFSHPVSGRADHYLLASPVIDPDQPLIVDRLFSNYCDYQQKRAPEKRLEKVETYMRSKSYME